MAPKSSVPVKYSTVKLARIRLRTIKFMGLYPFINIVLTTSIRRSDKLVPDCSDSMAGIPSRLS